VYGQARGADPRPAMLILAVFACAWLLTPWLVSWAVMASLTTALVGLPIAGKVIWLGPPAL